MSLQTASAAALLAGLRAFAGEQVVFSRGKSSVYVTTTPGRSLIEVDDGVRGRIQVPSADWMVAAADLRLSVGIVEPAEGDRIETSDGSVYELMTPPYRPSDITGTILRLHSKLISKP